MVDNGIARSGWQLASAEERNAAFPVTFLIPSGVTRRSLARGDAAQILIDIETKEDGTVIDRGVDRMWVIIISVSPRGYVGVLDSDPGYAENLKLAKGDLIEFNASHICAIDHPPKEFLTKKYGKFFP